MIANVCSGKQREREVYPQQLETKYFFKLFIVQWPADFSLLKLKLWLSFEVSAGPSFGRPCLAQLFRRKKCFLSASSSIGFIDRSRAVTGLNPSVSDLFYITINSTRLTSK